MKNTYKIFILLAGLFLLASCKPSDKYAGDWYAVTHNGEEFMVTFSKDKTMKVTGEDTEELHEMKQTATGIFNGIRYFRVKIENENYYVIFDDSKDEENAKFFLQTNTTSDFEDVVGDVIFMMNRNDYPSY